MGPRSRAGRPCGAPGRGVSGVTLVRSSPRERGRNAMPGKRGRSKATPGVRFAVTLAAAPCATPFLLLAPRASWGQEDSPVLNKAEAQAPPPERRVGEDPKGNPYVAGELIATYEERVTAPAEKAVHPQAQRHPHPERQRRRGPSHLGARLQQRPGLKRLGRLRGRRLHLEARGPQGRHQDRTGPVRGQRGQRLRRLRGHHPVRPIRAAASGRKGGGRANAPAHCTCEL